MKEKQIDWMITLVPLCSIVIMCICFFLRPESSNSVLSGIRFFSEIRWGFTILS